MAYSDKKLNSKKQKENMFKTQIIEFVLSPKRVVFLILSLIVFTGFLTLRFEIVKVLAAPGINQTVNFQGKVVNSDGTNVADGEYSFTFTLYDASSGGSTLWTETQGTVQVTAGIFRVSLGSVASLSSVNFNSDNIYLGINFNSDGEMTPRIRFASVPYAFNAQKVAGLTVTTTTGTLTIPDSTTVQFGGSFTTSAEDLTLTLSGATNVTLPTTGTLSTLAGSEVLTNKSIGSTGLVFSGATLDITTATNEDFTISANGAGNTIINLPSTGDFLIQDNGTSFASFLDDGTITLGKASATSVLGIGTGTAADTINIGTSNSTADTIVIGNNHTDSTLSLIGGNDWSITTTGNATFAGLFGAGLSDCSTATNKLLWNQSTGLFSCGDDMGSNLQVVGVDDTTTESLTTTNSRILDVGVNEYLAISPTSSSSSILINVSIRVDSDGTDSEVDVFTIYRTTDGSVPVCDASTLIGSAMEIETTNIDDDAWVAGNFVDAPGTTAEVRYTVCGDSIGGTASNDTNQITLTLTEIGTSSGGGGGGSISVRETDSSPSVGIVSALEFGPASASSAEFIVTDEGSGVARVRIGDQVGLLNEAETVTGGWNFGTASTTFSSAIQVNGGLGTATDTNLSITPAGTGNFVLNLDADTNAQFTVSQAPVQDIISVSNASNGTTTDGVNALQIDFETASIIGARSNAALQINVTSGATEGSDILYGINIGSLISPGGGSETALNIDTGWDTAIDTNGGNITAGAGSIFASTFDAVGAVPIAIGSSDVTSLTITTDGSGDGEVVLPNQSIGTAELVNDSVDATKLASNLTFSDGDLLDLSAITHNDSAPQGLILPQATSFTNPSSGEGYIAWNSSTNLVQVFDGANWVSVGTSFDFDDIYAQSVSNTNTTMEIDNALGLAFDLTTTGNFSIYDNGTAFAQFVNDGSITLGKASSASTINIGTGTAIDTINIGTGATGVDVISVGGGTGTLGINTANLTLTTAGLLTLYDTLELSGGASEGIRGGGLVDCDGLTDKLQWDSTTNKFSCSTDSSVLEVFDAFDNTGGDNISTGITVNLDTERKNSDPTVFDLASDVLTINQSGTYTFQFRVGATLTAGTRGAIRAFMEEDTGGGFTEIEGTRAYAYGRITTYPEATAVGFFTMDVASGSAYRVRSLVESGTFSTVADGSSLVVTKVDGVGGEGGGGSTLNIRETDSSPTVSGADTLEFGPVSSSSDEFVVTDEGGGVARVRLGSQVALLNQTETITGAWTFSGSSTSFTTGVIIDSGVTSSSSNNISFTPGGTGDFVVNLDADTNAQFVSSAAPGVDILSLSNSSFGTTTNNVDGLQIDFATAAVSGARTNAGIQLNVTSGATEASDTLYGINVSDLTSPSSGSEIGIRIGSNWDIALDAGTGTIIASNWDGLGTATLTIGSADTPSLTVTTDGTGDSEVILPAQSIGASEIVDNAIDASKLAATITFSDGDFLDLSGITHSSSSNMGLLLPQANTLTGPSSGEGYLAWDVDDNRLQVFNGTVWRDAGVTTFDAIYDESVARGDVNMAISDGAGLIFDMTSSGNFVIQDNGTPIATFGADGSLVFAPNSTGNFTINVDSDSFVGIGTSTPLATLDVRGSSTTAPGATISADTTGAGLTVDNNGDGDLLRVQKLEDIKFAVLNSGEVQISNLSDANCDVKADNAGLLYCGTEVGADGVIIDIFTSNDTWTKADYSGLEFVQVITTGGGAGGGSVGGAAGDTASEHAAGGGGGGGTAIEMISEATLNASETVTVGTGGGGGTSGGNGTAGSASSFGTTPYHTANGGGAGQGPGANGNACTATNSVAVGGAGGTASGGDANITGGSGVDGACLAEFAMGGNEKRNY